MEQKASIDALFALAFGLYTYVNPVLTITGGADLMKLLTEDLKHLTGGVLHMELDTKEAIENMLKHIEANRKKLGI